MSRLILLSVFVAAAVVVVVSSSSAPSQLRQKRGFRNAALSTARGFGKRMQAETLEDLGLHADLNRPMSSSWLAEQVVRSPALAKLLVEKVIDQNGDGMIHPEEMYPSV